MTNYIKMVYYLYIGFHISIFIKIFSYYYWKRNNYGNRNFYKLLNILCLIEFDRVLNNMKKDIVVLSLVGMLLLSSFAFTSVIADTTPTFDDTFEEGFEDGIMPPPGGWYTIDENPFRPWSIVNATWYPDFVHSGDYAAWINYDSLNYSDNWLISPDYDLSTYSEATLSFWAASDTLFPGATMELYIRGDGFDDLIWNMTQDEVWGTFEYREKTFNLSSYCSGVVNISWRYVGLDGESFGLDDISLYLEDEAAYISITEPIPIKGATNVDVNQATVSVNITADHTDGTSVSEYAPTQFDWEIGGEYIEYNSSTNDLPGRKQANLTTPLPYGTNITWYVNVSVDGSYMNITYYFTTVKHNEPPVANFTYLVEGLKVTFNGSISSDPDGSIENYTWDFDDGNYSYIANPQHIFAANGSYNVNLTVRDSNDTTDSYNQTIDVTNARPIVGFTAEPDGKTVTFTSTSYDVDGNVANHTWDFGDGNTSYDENPVHTYAQENKQYDVTLTVMDNLGLTNSTTQTVKTEDTTDPMVDIVTPERAVYINGEKKFGRLLGMAIIIGDITIEANASDEGSGIAKVEFYGGLLGTKLLGNETEAPYTFEWTRDRIRFFHIQMLKVVAYDNEGNTAMDRMIVRKFL
jgi:PKD repeat protein